MKALPLPGIVALVLLASTLSTRANDDDRLRAFPGAEGFGARAIGGRSAMTADRSP